MSFDQLKDEIISANTVPAHFYETIDVKRGLRNADGSGVIAGLSRISSVKGSEPSEQGPMPVDGVLHYRGIGISDLVTQLSGQHSCFEQTVFLLLVGRLPDSAELSSLRSIMAGTRIIPEGLVTHAIRSLPSLSVMNKLQTVVSALYTEDESADSLDPYENVLKALAIISQLPMAAAYAYLSAYVDDPQYVLPSSDMSIARAFLMMLRQGEAVSELEESVLDLALLLHAEHGGGNNSSFTTTVVSSSGSDIYSALSAAIGSLKGPLHGGANKAVMEMMQSIKTSVSNWSDDDELRNYLAQIVSKEAHDGSGKLYGLGHAVYTKSDPRAVLIREKAAELAGVKGRMDEFLLYDAVAKLGPEVFQEVKGSSKVISPNVDFYSGFVYDCLGIPQEVYTPLFAMARSAGWSAHRIEEILSGKRVIRPAYKFVND